MSVPGQALFRGAEWWPRGLLGFPRMPLGLAEQNIEANGMLILLPGARPTKFLHHLHFFFQQDTVLGLQSFSSSRLVFRDKEQWPIKIRSVINAI